MKIKIFLRVLLLMMLTFSLNSAVRAANVGALTNDPIAISPKVWVMGTSALDSITVHIANKYSNVDLSTVAIAVTDADGNIIDVESFYTFADNRGDLVIKFSPDQDDLFAQQLLTVQVNFTTLADKLPRVYITGVTVINPTITTLLDKVIELVFGSSN